MIIELVASRVVSPYLGNSLIVWTSLIGVILGCLSIGYYFGGKMADRFPDFESLGGVILWGAFSLAMTAFFKEPVLQLIQFSLGNELRAISFISIMVLFGPASIFLGMITPYAAKLQLSNTLTTGKTVGNLYALSTFGSISGTFLAGFYLIPLFGNSDLLYALSLSLVLISVIAQLRWSTIHKLVIGLLALLYFLNQIVGVFRLKALADLDSWYNRIIVQQATDSKLNKLVVMSVDNSGIQSAIQSDQPNELYFGYTKAYRVSDVINGKLNKTLLIGGGGYSYPRDYLFNHPNGHMDVVEIDPAMTMLARRYFFLVDDPRLNIFHQDARLFLQRSEKRYEAIFLDAFNSLSPPFHLTTKEFMSEINRHLIAEGFLMINLVSAITGDKSQFMRAERSTLLSVFSFVEVYAIEDRPEEDVQNLLVVAYKSKPDILLPLHKRITDFGVQTRILTDDWSPVEYLTRNLYVK
ncbi:MAG: hypothetical protein UX47_C0003G0021 [Candidatus Collierbacteria bacterium GW2011_GWA2_46_26]|uniref:PABS domain-containing protein n=1 Tax=Candidatus Collierbacteria bacterium GW2011_GWA2_46_26 TaxID=1618381 RepID=A0A0G1RU34_9BACT|nr:MAG: hypothetical protein UW29_C0002G0021 [Candidatus Collierbacteria bacterium GW2011_GWC2_44_13]KKU33498.1 MAG: hypothetical protein UX47_C0003G0021 [Candidatus Collierbacteria bacterium GW2011_GWA2_46_26]